MVLVSPPPPLLPAVMNPTATATPSHLEAIIQTLHKLELGKIMLTLAATATLGLLFSQKFDPAAQAHHFIVSGFMAAFMILWNGILLKTVYHRLGNILELLGISLILLFLFGLVATFLSGGFSLACWIFGALCLLPFIFLLIKPVPHAAAAA